MVQVTRTLGELRTKLRIGRGVEFSVVFVDAILRLYHISYLFILYFKRFLMIFGILGICGILFG